MSERILALDPAARTGWAHSCGECGAWDLGKDKALSTLLDRLEYTRKHYGVDRLASEESGFGVGNRSRTTLARHNEKLGIIKLFSEHYGIPLSLYKPTSIKSFAGVGRGGGKEQIIKAAQTFFPGESLPDDGDVCDARWVLEMARQNYETKKQATKRIVKSRRKRKKLF